MFPNALAHFIVPLAFVLSGVLFGVIFETIIIAKIKQIASHTSWLGDYVLMASLHGYTKFWFILAGIYAAVINVTIHPVLFFHIKQVLVVLAILSVTLFLSKLASGLVSLYSQSTEGILPSTSIFVNLSKIVIFLIGILIILQSLGISIAPILTALGVGGLAVALALQETLSNFFSGLYIIASRQIKPGDYVKLATGEEGYIVDVTWRNTTVQNLLNNMIIVPNSKLASVNITNFNQPVKEITITLDLGVSLDSDLTKVERVTVEVAREVMKEVVGGVVEFEPFVRFNSVADYSLRFTVIIRAQEFKDQFLLKHELIKRLFQRYHKEGIAFPYPVREVFFKNQG